MAPLKQTADHDVCRRRCLFFCCPHFKGRSSLYGLELALAASELQGTRGIVPQHTLSDVVKILSLLCRSPQMFIHYSAPTRHSAFRGLAIAVHRTNAHVVAVVVTFSCGPRQARQG